MKFLLLIFLFVSLVSACSTQTKLQELEWKEFVSEEVSLKIKIPCEPQKSVKSFQEEPEPIRVYSFGCESDGNKFLIGFKNHMSEFEPDKLVEELENADDYFRKEFADATVEGKTVVRNGLPTRITEVYFQNGNLNEAHFHKERARDF